jgi:hypothetical protein
MMCLAPGLTSNSARASSSQVIGISQDFPRLRGSTSARCLAFAGGHRAGPRARGCEEGAIECCELRGRTALAYALGQWRPAWSSRRCLAIARPAWVSPRDRSAPAHRPSVRNRLDRCHIVATTGRQVLNCCNVPNGVERQNCMYKTIFVGDGRPQLTGLPQFHVNQAVSGRNRSCPLRTADRGGTPPDCRYHFSRQLWA